MKDKDPIALFNFTDSLRDTIKKEQNLSNLIAKDIGEMKRRTLMTLDQQLVELDIEYKLSELKFNDDNVVCSIVYDGIRYE